MKIIKKFNDSAIVVCIEGRVACIRMSPPISSSVITCVRGAAERMQKSHAVSYCTVLCLTRTGQTQLQMKSLSAAHIEGCASSPS